MIVPHDQLRIDEDISAENQRRNDAIDELDPTAVWEERSHEAEHDQDPQTTEEIWHPRREVILCLASKQRECYEDAQGQDQSFDDNLALIKARNHGDGIGFQCREGSQEDHVRRI